MSTRTPALPRVSVCVMTYNHAPYISQCIDSALVQAEDVDLEILVGDDNSEDSTQSIVSSFAKQFPQLIRPSFHAKRIGAASNYRSLVAQARGEFIAHLDGDDFWLPGKLRRQLDTLDLDRQISGVYTNALVVTRQGESLGVFNDGVGSRLTLSDLVLRGSFLNNSSCVYRKDLLQELLQSRTSLLDYEVQLSLARKGCIAYIDSLLTAYRWGSESSMLSNRNAEVREMYWRALSSVTTEEVTPDVLARGMAVFLRSVFFRTLSTRDTRLLRGWWPRVQGASPVPPACLARLTVTEIFRTGCYLSLSRVAERLGMRTRVFYPR